MTACYTLSAASGKLQQFQLTGVRPTAGSQETRATLIVGPNIRAMKVTMHDQGTSPWINSYL